VLPNAEDFGRVHGLGFWWRPDPEQQAPREAVCAPANKALWETPLPRGWVRITSTLVGFHMDFCSPRCARLFLQRLEKQ